MHAHSIFRTLVRLAVLPFCFVVAAHAQDKDEGAPAWAQHIGEQLGQALVSPVDEVRHEALQHIAYFAYFYKDTLDLSDVVPDLLTIYKENPDEQSRLLALAALHAMGDEAAMQEVRRYTSVALEKEKSLRVQFVTLAALMQYYGEGTFEEDEEAAKLARALLEYYTGPRVIVEPPVVIERQ